MNDNVKLHRSAPNRPLASLDTAILPKSCLILAASLFAIEATWRDERPDAITI